MRKRINKTFVMGLLIAVWTFKAAAVEREEKQLILTNALEQKVKISAYGSEIFRIQRANKNEAFLPDSYYEMVESHDWRTVLSLNSHDDYWQVSPKSNSALVAHIDKHQLTITYYLNGKVVLNEQGEVRKANTTKLNFKYDAKEHFTGLGHGYYARANSIDLKGQKISRNYGSEPIEQAPLIVPFYLSSKGYGIFLNSTFSNSFNFGEDNEYSLAIDDLGFKSQLDYFFIGGSKLPQVLNNYTELTGRPRLPQKAMFGLQLSDKGHDHNTKTPSDENWWKQKISEHREAGYPLDHLINDNRWRAAGGKRCESKLAWDSGRYPDPAAYKKWLDEHGLVYTLDFNRCIASKSEGWKPSFNLPNIDNIQFPESAPDLTNPEFQQWFWQVFEEQGLKPTQNYPGDALWIDEFDEQGAADKTMVLSNGRSSGEMRNYWFFLIAKALVEQGWDKSPLNKRPFVWVRGMTAGAQRYATLWSGDIYPNYGEMAGQVRGMQLAGLSGFPFWGHDAGGFYDWKNNVGPDEALYQRWAIAMGSFSPIWKPHGMGQSRWPLDRSKASQTMFTEFAKLRYQLMPYTYTAAHQAANTGLPMVRAMVLDYQALDAAWQYDLQYLWGDSILVAPLTEQTGTKEIWLPPGSWYEYGSSQSFKGDTVISRKPALNQLPLFVKAGSIIPRRPYALSTAFIDKSQLSLDIYTGRDATYTLVEDDDVTENYQSQGQLRQTEISYQEAAKRLVIKPAKGHFSGENKARDIAINIYRPLKNKTEKQVVYVNGKPSAFMYKDGVITLEVSNVSVATELMITW